MNAARDPAPVALADPLGDMVASDLAEPFAALMLTLSPDRIIVGDSVVLGQSAVIARATHYAGERLTNYVADDDVATLSYIVAPPVLKHDSGPSGRF